MTSLLEQTRAGVFRFPNIDVEGLIDLQASSVLVGAASRLKKITYLTMASGDLSGHGDTGPSPSQ
jgi:hypothetical protein